MTHNRKYTQLPNGKARRRGLIDRAFRVHDAKLLVIATEGRDTEPAYFDSFQTPKLEIKVLRTGLDGKSGALSVLERLDDFRRQNELENSDELWLVIDVDHHEPKELADVCRLASQKGLHLAVSNPCFEFWIWLHHEEVASLPPAYSVCAENQRCKTIMQALRTLLGSYNKKNPRLDLLDESAYEKAILRASVLDTNPRQRWPSHPGSHAYKLVKRILSG